VPPPAAWNAQLGEFILAYDDVLASGAPDETVRTFLQTAYEAAARTAGWDRETLERRAG